MAFAVAGHRSGGSLARCSSFLWLTHDGAVSTPGKAGRLGAVIASEFAASEASLTFVSDEQPGIRRRKAGSGFSYVGPGGKRIRDRRELDRIKSLAIPP